MNLEKYLDRIRYQGPVAVNLEVLTNLQYAHLTSVPFENLNIIYKLPIHLSPDILFNKIVTSRRGGFCYEINGLFYELLSKLGYDVSMISAQVYTPSNGFGPEFDHMALLVQIEGEFFLTDVGFGEFATIPLRLEGRIIQQDRDADYCINQLTSGEYLVYKIVMDQWILVYKFSISKRAMEEFESRCNYHQTSDESHFTHGAICSLITDEGRITLSGQKFKITSSEGVEEYHVESAEAFLNLVKSKFGMKFPHSG